MRLIDADKITSGEIAKYLGRGYEFWIPDIEDMLKEKPMTWTRLLICWKISKTWN